MKQEETICDEVLEVLELTSHLSLEELKELVRELESK